MDALIPSVIEIWVARISAVIDPSTAASTTSASTGFLGDAALRAWRHYSASRAVCEYWYVSIRQLDILVLRFVLNILAYLGMPGGPRTTCDRHPGRQDLRSYWPKYRQARNN